MEFSLFKNLDKAFDNLERTVADTVQQAALSVVDEFPERSQTLQQKKLTITGASASASKTVTEAWEELSFEERKSEWQYLKEYLEKQPDDGVQWQQRAKLAEGKLLNLCTLLLKCPDPLPHLQQTASAAAKVLELEEQNRELRQAADAAYKDDAEVQGLLARFQALEDSHKALQEEVADKDAELASWRGSAAEMEAARTQQKEQLAELLSIKSALKALRVEYEKAQSQLFEFSSQQEQHATTTGTDVEVLLEQLERATAEIRELRRERDSLLAARAQTSTSGQHDGQEGSGVTAVAMNDEVGATGPTGQALLSHRTSQGREAYWEVQVQLREKQIERLQQELEASQSSAEASLQAAGAEVSRLDSQLQSMNERLQSLMQELELRPSHEDIKELQQRAEALQAMVDVQVEAEGWDSEAMTQLLRGSAGPTAVQTIVQERNRKLSAELTSLRQQLESKETDLHKAGARISQLETDRQQLLELVKKLENDLQAALANDGRKPSSRQPDGSSSPHPSTTALPISQPDPTPASAPSSVTAVPMVDIVARQRDRFKQRVEELEEELRRSKEDLTKARAKIDQLSSDNVSLYEKVRYLERYNLQRGGAAGAGRLDDAGVALDLVERGHSSSRYQCGPFMLDVPQMGSEEPSSTANTGLRGRARRACFGVIETPSGTRDVEQQYARAYEAQLNPFKAFREVETEQRVKNLGFGDRAILTGGKMLAGSKLARIFVGVYAALLHGFIMLLLYYSASPCTTRYTTVVHAPPAKLVMGGHMHIGTLMPSNSSNVTSLNNTSI